MPGHLAIMLDGNGRWAIQRGLSRSEGHRHGGENSKRIIRACGEIGLRYLTLFGFSTENWHRPWEEVKNLLELLEQYLLTQAEELKANNVRLISCGRTKQMPEGVLRALKRAEEVTLSCTGMTLNLAINYGGRAEILDACNRLLLEKLECITISDLERHLYCPRIPFPELLIRTSGEKRVSNFLLWQISRTYFWITPTLWPDFSLDDLWQAICDFNEFALPLFSPADKDPEQQGQEEAQDLQNGGR